MKFTRQQVVATHEAGHAICANELGSRVTWVIVNSDGSGECKASNLASEFDDAVIDVAGVLASNYRFGSECEDINSVDRQRFCRLPAEQRIKAIERALEILQRRWPDVESLAAQLLADPDGFVAIPFAPDYSHT